MKKKKGFVFVETLVVTAILTVSLLALYATYSALIIKEKQRLTYNDSVYLYRTYYLGKFLQNFNLFTLKEAIKESGYASITPANTLLFPNEQDGSENKNKALAETLYNRLHISAIFLTYKDLGYLQKCENWEGDCKMFASIDHDIAEYIKTIGGKSKTLNEVVAADLKEYRLIVKYTETKQGDLCDETTEEGNCQNFYTTISIGNIIGG